MTIRVRGFVIAPWIARVECQPAGSETVTPAVRAA